MDTESQNAQDARVEALWKRLDVDKKGELDLAGLQKGLRKIGHPLKNADDLLRQVMKAVDTSGDGKIQYEEFRIFVEHAEAQLFSLFDSIDRDHNGQIDKDELQVAFKNAGLDLAPAKLDQFFSEVDTDHNGEICFDEWRNFLLFLPSQQPGLKAVLSYYTATVTLNAEGDVQLSDETLQSLGISSFVVNILFGSIMKIMEPQKRSSRVESSSRDILAKRGRDGDIEGFDDEGLEHHQVQVCECEKTSISEREAQSSLTLLLPSPGYFVAGGISGVISRTATAPLDRLKVYLIAHTGVVEDSMQAAKKGDAYTAFKHVGRPLIDATKELWRAGGIRSLFAGNGINVVKVMPESAIKFGSYEGAKRVMARLEGHSDPKNINSYSQFIAGGLGGMISQLCVYPLDTLKFRMQSNVEANGLRGNALIIKTAKDMYKSGGIRSAYRGLTMGLVGMFPYSAIDLGTFEFLKRQAVAHNAKRTGLDKDDPENIPSSLTTGAIGAVSGAFGASVVYPVNLLRTRLQVQGTVLHPPVYAGVVDCAMKTVANEGLRGLFKGITPNLIKVVPAMSITYIVWEKSKQIMNLD